MKKGLKLLLVFGGIFILAVFIRLYVFRPAIKEGTLGRGSAMAERVTVKTVRARRGSVDSVLSYIGNLKARDEVNVYSKVSGKVVEYVLHEGDAVEKGQTIALIDRDETGLTYEFAKVESPLSGVLGRTFFDKGARILPETIMASGMPIAIVVSMDEMIVRLNIPEPEIPAIKKGLPAQVRVDAYPQEIFEGTITKVSEVVDPATRTLPIEITIPNRDHRLRSGMFARITIVALTRTDVLVLPLDALVQEYGVRSVFIVRDGKAHKKEVSLGARQDGSVEIVDGVSEGEEVIVFGQQGLKDGASVQAVSEESLL